MSDRDAAPGTDDDRPEFVVVAGHRPDQALLLARALTEAPWNERMRARRTASIGRPYNYSGMRYPEVPWPDWLAEVRDGVGRCVGFQPDNCLLNHYADGERSMGFHVDALDDLAPGTGVAIVSLGASRTLRFRALGRRQHTVDVRLEPGSLLYMPPAVQLGWQHALPPEPGAGERISLTFRRLA